MKKAPIKAHSNLLSDCRRRKTLLLPRKKFIPRAVNQMSRSSRKRQQRKNQLLLPHQAKEVQLATRLRIAKWNFAEVALLIRFNHISSLLRFSELLL